jgi:hypothetical protein
MHVDEQHPTLTRVAVVGTGNVGATFAYALLLSGLAAEMVLIGEALDLAYATPFTHSTRIWAGDWPDVAGAAITVIAAGANQAPGETRLDLLAKNAAIFRQIVPEIVRQVLRLALSASERVALQRSGTVLREGYRRLVQPTELSSS